MEAKLSTKQRQFLKGKGHSLRAVLQIGKEGLEPRVLASISKVLDDHELVKLTLLETAGIDKKEAAEQIAQELNAHIVQLLGFKLLVYRRNKANPRIVLP